MGLSFESNFQIIFRTHPKCCVGCDEQEETEELTSQVGYEVSHDVCRVIYQRKDTKLPKGLAFEFNAIDVSL